MIFVRQAKIITFLSHNILLWKLQKHIHLENLSSITHNVTIPTKYALLSVSDKSGIAEFAETLHSLGFTIISTGGTAKTISESGVQVTPIQEITGNLESFDGRMKTISFQVEGGILFDRSNATHVKEAKKLKVPNIEIVVANLYPFEKTTSDPSVKLEQAIESIDVGGPTMVRSAAKNFRHVLVVIDPNDYGKVIEALKTDTITLELRQSLAAKAFDHLSFYDAQIARFLRKDQFPMELALPGRKERTLRYGENPHQKAAVYVEPNTNSPLSHLQKLTGRDLSYVNFSDIAAGLESVRMFNQPATVVIKHNSPCGIALGKTAEESLRQAVAADPESAFGGAIVLNRDIDLKAAETFAAFKQEGEILIDIVAAPHITDEAKEFIKKVRRSTGIYTFGDIPEKRSNSNHYRFFDGGFLVQDWEDQMKDFSNWKVVTKRKPTPAQLKQMQLAWQFISRIRSNSIIVIDKKLPMTRGIGTGQTSRVRATRLALEQAKEHAEGSILASDSFFPFDDSVKLAAKHGIKAIVEQGGSRNDQASIDAADEAGIAMVFTGQRQFWH